METIYDVDYFIAKFRNTRDNMWTTGALINDIGQTCALGWCGLYNQNYIFCTEARALNDILQLFFIEGVKYRGWTYDNATALINNGEHPNYQQRHPKQRILAALYDIKKMQEPKPTYENISKSLAILPINETSDKTSTPKPLKQLQ